MTRVIVSSFYTTDDYYTKAADLLRQDLERIGVEYELRAIEKAEGEDWADICRKKVPFLQEICEEHPDAIVIWVDVDCRLIELPDYITRTTADIVGFGRGFSSALKIGYRNRSRFWEPCFWAIAPTASGRRMVSDAARLESTSDVKATDDYFFEEAWRANADRLNFQIIPSGAALGKGNDSVSSFLVFGSSGSVDEFKGKVAQHARQGATAKKPAQFGVFDRVVAQTRGLILKAPAPWPERVLGFGKRSGLTSLLQPDSTLPPADSETPTPTRHSTINSILQAGLDNRLDDLEHHAGLLTNVLLSDQEHGTVDAARAFAHYGSSRTAKSSVKLKWWVRPFPGNFGDWLSPYLLGEFLDVNITYLRPDRPHPLPHLMAVGSIARFADAASVVVGAGVSRKDTQLDTAAKYVSLRGPLTAGVLKSQGGPVVERFGDPGVLIDRAFPATRGETNGRIAVVRHFTQRGLPLELGEGQTELSILGGSPLAIEGLIEQLIEHDGVVTSAMHVMIVCHAYGIPCALVTFEGLETSVHGDGMKYLDYALGAEVEPMDMHTLPLDLRGEDLRSLLRTQTVAESVKDRVQDALHRGLAEVGGL